VPSYTCDTIANGFIAESGRFSGELYRKVSPSGPWLAGTPRGEWKDGMGKILNNILFERTVPATDTSAPGAASNKWVDEVFSDGGSNDACLPTPEIQNWGQTSRPYNVQVRNLQTPEFCVEDLRSDYDIEKMIDALLSNLEWGTGYVWEDRNRHEYIRLAEHKVTETANAGFDIDGQTSFDLVSNPPTSRLTMGTLEWIYEQLEADGASLQSNGRTNSTSRPVFDLYTDSVSMRDLVRQDPNLRDDFRWAYSGKMETSPLLQTLGTPWSWNGFRFVHDRFPERYNVVNGVAVRVPPYLDPELTATKGYKQDRNPAYKFAQYQISVIHIPAVYKQLVKRPISQLGKFKFDPVKYTGDFQMLRIPDKKCNPRGTKLFLDAIFASSSEPGLTYLGWAIAHKNCPPLRTTYISCYS
jgi:hypothetical protein